MLAFILYFIIFCLYSVFSYSVTEPNLVLSSNSTYWSFQQFMWQTFYSEGPTVGYILLIFFLSMFLIYYFCVNFLSQKDWVFDYKNYKIWLRYIVLVLPLFLAYNSLSHDIFNYAFNAKMVAVYGYDPHQKVAMDFIDIDDWTRFMHNIHTTAPYGYGWTALSLIPFYLGFGKFVLILFNFRVFMFIGLLALALPISKIYQTLYNRPIELYKLAIFYLNPLVLIEVITNYHNDVYMMFFALVGMSLLLSSIKNIKWSKQKQFAVFVISTLFLGLSVFIKLATVALVPIWFLGLAILSWDIFIYKFSKMIEFIYSLFINKFIILIPTFAAILMFTPLLTARSQQFLPWYLVWLLVFIPLIENKTVRNTILIFSISSLLRYIPFFNNYMQYNEDVIMWQKITTFLLPLVYLTTNIQKNVSIFWHKKS